MTDSQHADAGQKAEKQRASKLSVWVIGLVALLLPAVFNPYIFHAEQGWALSLFSHLASAGLTLFILTLSCRIRTLGFIILPIILTCALADWFLYMESGLFISGAIVACVLETDINEASAYFTFTNIAGVVVFITLMVAGILIGHKKISSKSSNVLMLVSLVVFGLFAAISYPIGKAWRLSVPAEQSQYRKHIRHMTRGMFWPVQDVVDIFTYVKSYLRSQPQLNKNIMGLPSGYGPDADGEELERDFIVVMMIGESLRADHLGINGYERDTTPCLGEWQEKGQLICYPHTCSFGLNTRVSTIGLMTDAEIGTRTVCHRPYYDILTKDGVETVSLLSMNTDVDSGVVTLSEDCTHKYQVDTDQFPHNRLYGQTVDEFGKALGKHGRAERLFILLHDSGAHFPYHSLPENRRFLPCDFKSPKTAEPANLVNAYDNAVMEVDWELAALMQELEKTGRPAVFIYASDHGEALGEEGYFYHTVPLKVVSNTAIMIWCSFAYIEKFPERYAMLKSRADGMVAHDNMMHTILSLFGIHGGVYSKGHDLLSPEMQETVVPEDLSVLGSLKLPQAGQEGEEHADKEEKQQHDEEYD